MGDTLIVTTKLNFREARSEQYDERLDIAGNPTKDFDQLGLRVILL